MKTTGYENSQKGPQRHHFVRKAADRWLMCTMLMCAFDSPPPRPNARPLTPKLRGPGAMAEVGAPAS